jgi:hypothetical protein
MTPTLFIYHNKETKKTKVLCESDAKKDHDYLKLVGWEHTSTIDPCMFLEKLLNESDNIAKEVVSLKYKIK